LEAGSGEVGTGDVFSLRLSVREAVSGGGRVAMYVVAQTPGGKWLSFVPRQGRMTIVGGIHPAVVGGVIPAIEREILNMAIPGALTRGEYGFTAAVFNVGDAVTLSNWRQKAICASEAAVTVR